MHDPTEQLHQNLQDSIVSALGARLPILTHLNADTSWLLQLPWPSGSSPPPGRQWYNILIDPWFQGPQNDVASWFSSQWHAIQSSVQTIAELNSILLEIEILDYATRLQEGQLKTEKPDSPRNVASENGPSANFIDAVIISHEFTDHCHKETLLEVESSKAASLIRSWKHFSTVLEVPPFDASTDWKSTSLDPIPSWLGVSRVASKSDALHYHSAVLVAFDSAVAGVPPETDDSESARVLVYSPHGIYAEDLHAIPAAVPPVKTLALLHGLHDISLAKVQLNLGARNALKAQRVLDAKYWIGTHDEVKVAGGLVAPFLNRKVLTLQEVLDKAQDTAKKGIEALHLGAFDNAAFVDLGSGESLLLE